MRFIRYLSKGKERPGLLLDDSVIDLQRAFLARQRFLGKTGESRFPYKPGQMFCAGEDAWKAARLALDFILERKAAGLEVPYGKQVFLAMDEVYFLPPVSRPGKLVCAGLNYPGLGEGHARPAPQYPVLFHKAASALTGHNQPILIPRISKQIEYEGELTVVIGKRGKYIPREEAPAHIAGYTIANDVGARDIQQRTSQWASGKMFDTFCPLGPALVTRDEVPDPNALRILTTLNHKVVQDGNTGEMLFDVCFLVSYISTLATLEPGDMILTGSPKRAGDRPDPRIFMQRGDTISIQIEKLGRLSNPVVAEE
jgi:acylpyruvate hydrolase